METYDVVIIGAGPAGIFTALELYEKFPDTYRVLVVDEGKGIYERTCPARKHGQCVRCNPCNIMSGWAGAGAFSDGKLSLSEEVGGNLTDYLPVDTVRDLIADQRPRLAAGLAALGCQVLPGEANYLLFRCGTPLAEPLRRRGILLRSCANYHGLGPDWYRAAVRTGPENRRLLAVLREVLG